VLSPIDFLCAAPTALIILFTGFPGLTPGANFPTRLRRGPFIVPAFALFPAFASFKKCLSNRANKSGQDDAQISAYEQQHALFSPRKHSGL
jgi:hypothetical protein